MSHAQKKIKAKNIIMKERTWINRVAQRDGEWLNMESSNLYLFKKFKTARANVQEVRLEPGRALTLRFVMLAVGSLFRSTEWCSAR